MITKAGGVRDDRDGHNFFFLFVGDEKNVTLGMCSRD